MALAGVTALVSGVAVYVNGFGVRAWVAAGTSPTTYTTAKNVVAALLLLGLAGLAARRRGAPLAPERRTWPRLLVVGVLGGAVPFVLFFEGLAVAESAQAALIHKSLLVWVALLAVPLLGERVGGMHLGAFALLIAGQVTVAGGIGGLSSFGRGEAMILAATLLWAVEVIVAKQVLADVPAATVGLARMGVGAVVLVGWLTATGALSGMFVPDAAAWGWIVVTGGTLALYVASWYMALAAAPAVDVTAVLVVGALITAGLASGLQGAEPPSLLGIGLVLGGAALTAGASIGGRRAAASPG
jgi:MYXO-CTERM domain-containing protein